MLFSRILLYELAWPFAPSCVTESGCSGVKQKRPERLLKRSLVSQAASIFVTQLKMCLRAIPITPHPPSSHLGSYPSIPPSISRE